jgi:hypothetical protein
MSGFVLEMRRASTVGLAGKRREVAGPGALSAGGSWRGRTLRPLSSLLLRAQWRPLFAGSIPSAPPLLVETMRCRPAPATGDIPESGRRRCAPLAVLRGGDARQDRTELSLLHTRKAKPKTIADHPVVQVRPHRRAGDRGAYGYPEGGLSCLFARSFRARGRWGGGPSSLARLSLSS